ncbi:MAG: UDP-N-acetylmuramate--L-alanine ligase, partial [Schleiferiaceae bacterium]
LYPNEKICLCFQPHLFSRTRDFMDGFAQALDRADEVLLLPIYPARELPIEGITSEALAAKMSKARVVEKAALAGVVKAADSSVVLVVGAGDIGDLVPMIKAEFA